MPVEPSAPLLRVRGLRKNYPMGRRGTFGPRQTLQAVADVSFDIARGETLGLVGESGCGKSTVAKLIARLLEPTGGEILYEGRDLCGLSKEETRQLRRQIQIVFQDPYASLNPRMTVGEIVSEAWRVFPGILERHRWHDRTVELLRRVGLHADDVSRYPHQFSGGQRQRIGIARALAPKPEFIICDEPVSALDVSVQAQVINLLADLQEDFRLSYLFIAHDLSVVRHVCDRVLVMYLGKIVEAGPTHRVYERPTHPYTQALLSSVPICNPFGREERRRDPLEGEVPSQIDPPSGCSFHPRCQYARERCSNDEPTLRDHAPGQQSACHFAEARNVIPSATLPIMQPPE